LPLVRDETHGLAASNGQDSRAATSCSVSR